jgi:hypothetical protein
MTEECGKKWASFSAMSHTEFSPWYIGGALGASVALWFLAYTTERRGRGVTEEQWKNARTLLIANGLAAVTFHLMFTIDVGHKVVNEIECFGVEGSLSLFAAVALVMIDVVLVMWAMLSREIRMIDRVHYLAMRYGLDERKIMDGFARYELQRFPFTALETHVAKNATLSEPDSISAEAEKYIDDLFQVLDKENPSHDEISLWQDLCTYGTEKDERGNLLYDISCEEFARVCLPRHQQR